MSTFCQVQHTWITVSLFLAVSQARIKRRDDLLTRQTMAFLTKLNTLALQEKGQVNLPKLLKNCKRKFPMQRLFTLQQQEFQIPMIYCTWHAFQTVDSNPERSLWKPPKGKPYLCTWSKFDLGLLSFTFLLPSTSRGRGTGHNSEFWLDFKTLGILFSAINRSSSCRLPFNLSE